MATDCFALPEQPRKPLQFGFDLLEPSGSRRVVLVIIIVGDCSQAMRRCSLPASGRATSPAGTRNARAAAAAKPHAGTFPETRSERIMESLLSNEVVLPALIPSTGAGTPDRNLDESASRSSA